MCIRPTLTFVPKLILYLVYIYYNLAWEILLVIDRGIKTTFLFSLLFFLTLHLLVANHSSVIDDDRLGFYSLPWETICIRSSLLLILDLKWLNYDSGLVIALPPTVSNDQEWTPCWFYRQSLDIWHHLPVTTSDAPKTPCRCLSNLNEPRNVVSWQ